MFAGQCGIKGRDKDTVPTTYSRAVIHCECFEFSLERTSGLGNNVCLFFQNRSFVDMKRITIHAGKGGDGCIAFDRLFCNPNGGPSGGDGGNGGHIIFQGKILLLVYE